MNETTMVEIPQAPTDCKLIRGTWFRVFARTPEPEYRGYWTAIVCCPECGKLLNAINHTIDSNGRIEPSLGHPKEYPACSWHTRPRLLGWCPNNWVIPDAPSANTCEKCGFISHGLGGWGTWSGGKNLICPNCVKEINQ